MRYAYAIFVHSWLQFECKLISAWDRLRAEEKSIKRTHTHSHERIWATAVVAERHTTSSFRTTKANAAESCAKNAKIWRKTQLNCVHTQTNPYIIRIKRERERKTGKKSVPKIIVPKMVCVRAKYAEDQEKEQQKKTALNGWILENFTSQENHGFQTADNSLILCFFFRPAFVARFSFWFGVDLPFSLVHRPHLCHIHFSARYREFILRREFTWFFFDCFPLFPFLFIFSFFLLLADRIDLFFFSRCFGFSLFLHCIGWLYLRPAHTNHHIAYYFHLYVSVYEVIMLCLLRVASCLICCCKFLFSFSPASIRPIFLRHTRKSLCVRRFQNKLEVRKIMVIHTFFLSLFSSSCVDECGNGSYSHS